MVECTHRMLYTYTTVSSLVFRYCIASTAAHIPSGVTKAVQQRSRTDFIQNCMSLANLHMSLSTNANSSTIIPSSASASVSTLPQLTHALPPRPTFDAAPIPSQTKHHHHSRNRDRSPTSPPPRRDSWTDTYRPQQRHRDTYLPSLSPEPYRRATKDTYTTEDFEGRRQQGTDSYRPDRERRNRSRSRSRDRRDYSTSASRSPEKRGRYRSPSLPRVNSRPAQREDRNETFSRETVELPKFAHQREETDSSLDTTVL